MSRSYKEQAARREREMARAYTSAFNRALQDGDEESVRAFSKIETQKKRALRDEGPVDGRRYGNSRHSHAEDIKQARRADRKAHIHPMHDADGEVGLESRPTHRRKPW